MNNEPVAWMWSEDGCNMGVCLDKDKQIGKQEFQDYSIPLYTHPAKEQELLGEIAHLKAELDTANKAYMWMDETYKGVLAELELLKSHPVKEQEGCGNCHACLVGVTEHGLPVTFQRMILCPDCGNKRCPKASNHRHQCTESNEPNQRGSIYTHPAELTDEEMLESAEGAGCVFDYSYKGEVTFISKNALKRFVLSILRKAQEK